MKKRMEKRMEKRSTLYKLGQILLSVIIVVGILIISQVISQTLTTLMDFIKIPTVASQAIGAVAYVGFTLILSKGWIEKCLKEKMSDYKIGCLRMDKKWIAIGLLLPLVVSFFYICLPGEWQMTKMSGQDKITWLSNGILYVGFAVGFVEEILFRGILMTRIEKIASQRLSIWLPSILFGLIHTIGMPFNLVDDLLVIIAGTSVGVMFSYIALSHHSIWNSGIVHGLWNIVIIGGILHVGTAMDPYSLYSYVIQSKIKIISGGDFGIESSAIAIVAYILVAIYAKRTYEIQSREQRVS